MSQKKYIGLSGLSTFLDNLKNIFATLMHTHSYDELRNKPFYEGTDYSSILANGSSTVNFYEWGSGVYGAAVTNAPQVLAQDVSHKVIWDGVEYTMNCTYGGNNESDNPITSLGAPYGDYSEYPFGIDSYQTADGTYEYSIHTNSTDTTHTIDILELGSSYVTLDEKFIPQSIYTEFDAIKEAKADWNQSDETKLDYIKNRTHWAISEPTTYVDEEVNMSLGVHYFESPFPLNIGQIYTVVFDGTTYECVAFKDGNNYNRATIGGSYEDYSTYPFSVFVMSDSYTGIKTGDYNVHTVKISTVIETVQKLDEKYIPDTFAKNSDMENMVNDVENTLSDKINRKVNISDIDNGFNFETVSTMNSSSWDGVVYGDNKYVAVNSTSFAYSTDGINWEYGTLPISASGIAYGNGMYCAYGYSGKNICYSTDGINWNTADTNYNSNKFSIHFLNDRFYISAGYAILYSSDCENWSTYLFDNNYTNSYTLYGGAYGNGIYILSGEAVFMSTNGTSWTKVTMPTTDRYNSVHFVDGRFVAFGHWDTNYNGSDAVAYSTNGVNWTAGTLPVSANWVESSYGNGKFVVAGAGNIIYSNDGVDWTTGSLPDGWTTIDCMTYGKEFLLFRNNEVAFGKQNPYDLVYKSNLDWTQIYSSGETTEQINSFADIDISGYKKLMVAIKCVNDTTNASTTRYGSVIFKATNGTTYQFPVFNSMFFGSATTTANLGFFEITDGWIICPQAARSIKYDDFLTSIEGGTCTNMNGMGGGLMKCTNVLSTMTISSLDQNADFYFGVGSQVIVWGCK